MTCIQRYVYTYIYCILLPCMLMSLFWFHGFSQAAVVIWHVSDQALNSFMEFLNTGSGRATEKIHVLLVFFLESQMDQMKQINTNHRFGYTVGTLLDLATHHVLDAESFLFVYLFNIVSKINMSYSVVWHVYIYMHDSHTSLHSLLTCSNTADVWNCRNTIRRTIYNIQIYTIHLYICVNKIVEDIPWHLNSLHLFEELKSDYRWTPCGRTSPDANSEAFGGAESVGAFCITNVVEIPPDRNMVSIYRCIYIYIKIYT